MASETPPPAPSERVWTHCIEWLAQQVVQAPGTVENRAKTIKWGIFRYPTTDRGQLWEVYDRTRKGPPLFVASPGVVLLWALASEVGHARTGETVCRACSGTGQV